MPEERTVLMLCENEHDARLVRKTFARIAGLFEATKRYALEVADIDEGRLNDQELKDEMGPVIRRLTEAIGEHYPHGPEQLQQDINILKNIRERVNVRARDPKQN